MAMICCKSNVSPCCCGVPIRTGVKILASTFLLKNLLTGAYYASTIKEDWETADALDDISYASQSDDNEDPATIKWFLFYTAVIVFLTVDSAMALILFIGSSRGKVTHCRSWFVYGSLMLVGYIAMLVYTLMTDMNTNWLMYEGLSFLLYAYTLTLVGILKQDLKVTKNLAAAQLAQQVAFVNAIGNMDEEYSYSHVDCTYKV